MSTRANIIIKDSEEKLFFYRHSDGYPEGALPTLNKFMEWLKAGTIRNNVQQCSGWLILLGAIEYNLIPHYETYPDDKWGKGYGKPETIASPGDWKVGAYEPTTSIHGDIDYLYIIDLNKQELTAWTHWNEDGEGLGDAVEINIF